ncbi:dephospho-CoA kinase [Sporosarcina newyorkensis 2681]|uniref:Dephospho-CoA kinase n=1 Tax=Sporosarcina newyorkensis 2681 TaxID=1027292 RepID=F9DV09_9BACL|nr:MULTISPECIES: hypothetical protein [Bacillales]EGQ23794.1 dephospho-CoA kinase [Sporosarcina newyorkensis 2681]QPR67295.1 hypothetical protein I6G82_19070 [Lysinibacillus macroides]
MQNNYIFDFDTHYKELIFGEKDKQKIKANNFLHLFVDLIIDNLDEYQKTTERKEKVS